MGPYYGSDLARQTQPGLVLMAWLTPGLAADGKVVVHCHCAEYDQGRKF